MKTICGVKKSMIVEPIKRVSIFQRRSVAKVKEQQQKQTSSATESLNSYSVVEEEFKVTTTAGKVNGSFEGHVVEQQLVVNQRGLKSRPPIVKARDGGKGRINVAAYDI